MAFRQIKKETNQEERDKIRPLLRIKKDAEIKTFMEEVDRMEKKYEIGVMRETDQIKEFINKTKMDVTGAR